MWIIVALLVILFVYEVFCCVFTVFEGIARVRRGLPFKGIDWAKVLKNENVYKKRM